MEKVEKVREAVKLKINKRKLTSPKQLENMSCSYRRTRVNGTSAEFVVTLWRSKTWNLSQFSSCLAGFFFKWTGVKLRSWGWIARFICNLCNFDAVNRASVLGKPILRDMKNAEMPCEDPWCLLKVQQRSTEEIKSVFLYLLLYFILKIIEKKSWNKGFKKDVQVMFKYVELKVSLCLIQLNLFL